MHSLFSDVSVSLNEKSDVNSFCSQYPQATLVCVGGTSNKSSSDFVHSHELGCTSAVLIRKYHSMCCEALKTGLNIAGDVVQGRNIKQAAEARLKSTHSQK
jgi:hypothetical protein